MNLAEQQHKAACDRNLKKSYHGVLVKDFFINYDENRSQYKAILTLQIPFYDISPKDLMVWALQTFPLLKHYITNYDNCSLFNIQLDNITTRVIYVGRDRYTPNCPLYDIKLCIVDYAYIYENWNKSSIQQFLDRATCG